MIEGLTGLCESPSEQSRNSDFSPLPLPPLSLCRDFSTSIPQGASPTTMRLKKQTTSPIGFRHKTAKASPLQKSLPNVKQNHTGGHNVDVGGIRQIMSETQSLRQRLSDSQGARNRISDREMSQVDQNRPGSVASRTSEFASLTREPTSFLRGSSIRLRHGSVVPKNVDFGYVPVKGQKTWSVPLRVIVLIFALIMVAMATAPVLCIYLDQLKRISEVLRAGHASSQLFALKEDMNHLIEETTLWTGQLSTLLRVKADNESGPTSETILPALRVPLLLWLSGPNTKIGGVCIYFLEEFGVGTWVLCASRSKDGQVTWQPADGMTMPVYFVDEYLQNGPLQNAFSLDHLDPNDPKFHWDDGRFEWLDPWVFINRDGEVLVEIGLQTMVRVAGHRFSIRIWLEDPLSDAVFRDYLSENSPDAAIAMAAEAFMYSDNGYLIGATCGQLSKDKCCLISPTGSTCELIGLGYEIAKGQVSKEPKVEVVNFKGTRYCVGTSTVFDTHDHNTGYHLVLVLHMGSIWGPIVNELTIMSIVMSVIIGVVIIIMALLLSFCVTRPISRLAHEIDDFISLDNVLQDPLMRDFSSISELKSIQTAFDRMRYTVATLAKYVPIKVVQGSIQGTFPADVYMAPTTATVLFLDIENFTTLTETIEIRSLVLSVSAFFECISECIVQNSGTIDKYIGDCVMAVWNTPTLCADHEYKACQAALSAVEQMHTYADIPESYGVPALPRLRGRIGMESGAVYAGNFGSSHHLSFTVVGDVVNLASRLEGLNKVHETQILIGPHMYDSVRTRVRSRKIEKVSVKGKAKRLAAYELQGLLDQDSNWITTNGLEPVELTRAMTLNINRSAGELPHYPPSHQSHSRTHSHYSSPQDARSDPARSRKSSGASGNSANSGPVLSPEHGSWTDFNGKLSPVLGAQGSFHNSTPHTDSAPNPLVAASNSKHGISQRTVKATRKKSETENAAAETSMHSARPTLIGTIDMLESDAMSPSTASGHLGHLPPLSPTVVARN